MFFIHIREYTPMFPAKGVKKYPQSRTKYSIYYLHIFRSITIQNTVLCLKRWYDEWSKNTNYSNTLNWQPHYTLLYFIHENEHGSLLTTH